MLSSTEKVVHTNNRDCAELLYSHAEEISELKKEMRDSSRACTDDNILEVVCLAYNGLDVAAVSPQSHLHNPP